MRIIKLMIFFCCAWEPSSKSSSPEDSPTWVHGWKQRAVDLLASRFKMHDLDMPSKQQLCRLPAVLANCQVRS